MQNKEILVVCQYFYPEEFRINDICCEWLVRGYKVTVVTGIPNYPKGSFFKGYGILRNSLENWNGIDIIRLPIIPRGHNKMTLLLNYFSFLLSSCIWAYFSKNTHADKVFIYQLSPFSMAVAGIIFALRRNIPCFVYVLDLWPESVKLAGNVTNSFVLKVLDSMVDYVYTNATLIFAASKSFVNLIKLCGVHAEKVRFWPQYAEPFYHPMSKNECHISEIPDDQIMNFTFAGNIGVAQGLSVLLKCAILLNKNDVLVRFNIIGDGRYKEELIRSVEKEGLNKYFNFIARRPAEKIPQYFAYSDAALLTLAPGKIFEMTIPAKLQSAMACGMPIIAVADGEIQSIIQDAECGYFCNAGDSEGLYNIIVKVIANRSVLKIMGNNGRRYFENNYDKKTLMDWLEKEMEAAE